MYKVCHGVMAIFKSLLTTFEARIGLGSWGSTENWRQLVKLVHIRETLFRFMLSEKVRYSSKQNQLKETEL
jgi:hypothetical protein